MDTTVGWSLNSNIPHSLPTQDTPPPEETKESLSEDRKDELRNSHSTLGVTLEF